MKELISNNWSYCLSRHLLEEHKIELDERLCFVLSSSLGLRASLKYPTLNQNINNRNFQDVNINPLNFFALESFANNCNFLLCDLHDYGEMPKVEYLVKASIEDDAKFLISLSNKILSPNKEFKAQNTLPIFAFFSIPNKKISASYNFSDIADIKVELAISKKRTLNVSVKEFSAAWIVDNQQFNANRYYYVPTVVNDFDRQVQSLVKTALIRQYYALKADNFSSNIRLLKELKKELEGGSDLVIQRQKELLFSSLENQSSINGTDMNRKYYGQCIAYLNEIGLLNNPKLSKLYNETGTAWETAFETLKYSEVNKSTLLEIYKMLLNKEAATLNEFEKTIAIWIN